MHSDKKRILSAREQMKEAVDSVLHEAADSEDLGVSFHKRSHSTHPKAMARRTARIKELQEIVNRLHQLGDEHTSDGYPQSAFLDFHRIAGELEAAARKV